MYHVPPTPGLSLARRIVIATQIVFGVLLGLGCFLNGAADLLGRHSTRCGPSLGEAVAALLLGVGLLSLAWQHLGHLRRNTLPPALLRRGFWVGLLAGGAAVLINYATLC